MSYLERVKRFEQGVKVAEDHRISDAPTSAPTGDSIVMEPAAPNARPVFWERAEGIVGPGRPEFLAKVGTGSQAQFWVVAQFEGFPVWINSLILRTRREFEAQVPMQVVTLVKEPR